MWRSKSFHTLGNALAGRIKGSFGTSEGSEITGVPKAKQRKFTTEIVAEQHFPAKEQPIGLYLQ